MTLELSWELTQQKYSYQKWLTDRILKVEVGYAAQIE